MKITKGLIIADPWIGYLLDGTKDWEMRSSATSHRGWFGLIRKGTGAVHGVARLIEVGVSLSPAQMIASIDRHRIPEAMIRSGEVAKWNTPWKLAEVRRLARPVPYRHKSGAVTWVELDEAAIADIASQFGSGVVPSNSESATSPSPSRRDRSDGTGTVKIDVPQRSRKIYIDIEWDDGQPDSVTAKRISPAPAAEVTPPPPVPAVTSSSAGARVIGEVEITDGNIGNNHIYLRSFFDRFPVDAVGGSNKATRAKRELTVDWGGPEPVLTDLDGQKKFFRARGWIGAFYQLHRARAGDRVIVEETAPYRYRVSLSRHGLRG